MAAIIIPAHNEGRVIAGTLEALMPQLTVEDVVVVVANGCSDDTEKIAGRFSPRVLVLCTPLPSKVQALNLGDRFVGSFPKIYMDADVQLQEGALQQLKLALETGPWLAVAPDPQMDFSRSSWAVRAYYAIWFALPYCRAGMLVAGVYALSSKGRERFDRFPELISDDGFVRAQFLEHERGKVAKARVLLRAPRTMKWLLKIKVRSRMGQVQLAEAYPQLVSNQEKAYFRGAWQVLRNPLNWPAAAVYGYVALATRRRSRKLLRKPTEYRWAKDESSRVPLQEHLP